jgi:RNA polymerase sigma factor (sigma-70 family)
VSAEAEASGGASAARVAEVALHARVLANDAAATRELVARVLPAVRQCVSLQAGRHQREAGGADVDDAVQQVFLTLFARERHVLGRWRGQASLKTYVVRVAERVAIRHFQRGRLHQGRFRLDLDAPDSGYDAESLDALASEALGASVPTAEAALVDASEREALRAAILEGLSEKAREYYRWLFVEELDVAEICVREGTNPNNVYQWRNRLLKEVARLVEAHRAGVSDP